MPTTAARRALRQAAAEGLTLQPSGGTAGFKGVSFDGGQYQAWVKRGGTEVLLGVFASPEEAAYGPWRRSTRTA